jgi:glycine cleavage system H protein
MVPNDRRYTKEHEWVKVSGQTVTVGITDFAQRELGDIVYVELPEIGRTVVTGDVLGTIESVKGRLGDLCTVSGKIASVNTLLGDKPETVNSDAHGAGWICTMELARPDEVSALMDSTAYAALAGS